MNLNRKIIPRLEIKNGNLIKGVRMEGLRVLSNNLNPFINSYLKMSVKEIFIEDIVASLFNKKIDLQEQLNLTILFISHDLPVVRQMCDRIAVLRNGKLCEVSTTEELFTNPSHEYTKQLLRLMPKIESIYN